MWRRTVVVAYTGASLANGTYKWRVQEDKGLVWTATQSFTLNIPLPPQNVVLGAPNRTLTSWDGVFHWTGITGTGLLPGAAAECERDTALEQVGECGECLRCGLKSCSADLHGSEPGERDVQVAGAGRQGTGVDGHPGLHAECGAIGLEGGKNANA